MEITLRKANAIQQSINEALRSIRVETTIELNEFQEVPVELEKANTVLFENDARRQRLLLALYNIRALVGTANVASNIDSSLAKAAFVEKRIAQLEEIASLRPITDMAIILGKIEKIKNDKDSASRRSIYGHGDTVSTTVVSQEQINQAKAEIRNLKKQKQKLNDEILESNIKTTIPLSEDVVKTLTEEGLI